MSVQLKKTVPPSAIAITALDRATWDALAPTLAAPTRRWLKTVGFTGAAHTHARASQRNTYLVV